jgi:hypothetical protein
MGIQVENTRVDQVVVAIMVEAQRFPCLVNQQHTLLGKLTLFQYQLVVAFQVVLEDSALKWIKELYPPAVLESWQSR